MSYCLFQACQGRKWDRGAENCEQGEHDTGGAGTESLHQSGPDGHGEVLKTGVLQEPETFLSIATPDSRYFASLEIRKLCCCA